MANIFQQYLTPPKSVLEYSADLDQADARRQSLQQNALALAAGQQKFDEQQQSTQRAAQLRSALLGLPQGATDDERIAAMRGTATPEGFAAADALSKSVIEQRKGTAAAKKDEADAAKTQLTRDVALHDFHAQKLATVQTPEDALAWAQEGKALGIFNQPGQYERGVAAIQQAAQSPQTFAQWKAAAMQGGQSVTEQLKQKLAEAKQAEDVRQFNVTDQRTRAEGAANRAVQIRGQNLTDARARDLGQQGQYDQERGVLVDKRTGIARPVMGADGKPMQGGQKMTEDQAKATGWLVQAENAWKNMQTVGLDKDGNPTSAAKPGFNDALSHVPGMGGVANSFRSADRQKFTQAASSLSEALLRAATGAGVNREEAAQKVAELTPQFGESTETTKQKFASIPLYIESLKVRSGPGAAKAATVLNSSAASTPPKPAGGIKFLGFE